MPDEISAGDMPACACCGCDRWRPAGLPYRGVSIATKAYDDFGRVAEPLLPRPVVPAFEPASIEPTFEEEPEEQELRIEQDDLFGGQA